MAKTPFRMMISYWTTIIADDVNDNVEDIVIENLGGIFREMEELCHATMLGAEGNTSVALTLNLSNGYLNDFSISKPYKMINSKSDLREWGNKIPINSEGNKTCREYLEDIRREELLSSLSDEDKRILGIG